MGTNLERSAGKLLGVGCVYVFVGWVGKGWGLNQFYSHDSFLCRIISIGVLSIRFLTGIVYTDLTFENTPIQIY